MQFRVGLIIKGLDFFAFFRGFPVCQITFVEWVGQKRPVFPVSCFGGRNNVIFL